MSIAPASPAERQTGTCPMWSRKERRSSRQTECRRKRMTELPARLLCGPVFVSRVAKATQHGGGPDANDMARGSPGACATSLWRLTLLFSTCRTDMLLQQQQLSGVMCRLACATSRPAWTSSHRISSCDFPWLWGIAEMLRWVTLGLLGS